MSSITSKLQAIPQGSGYSGCVEISEKKDDTGLTVYIETEDLRIRSVKKEDISHYQKLFSDPKVMKTFAAGKTYTLERAKQRVEDWVGRWEACNPFSAFSYFKKEGDEFVGFRVLGAGDYLGYCSDINAGYSETASANMACFWGNGYAKQGAFAIVHEFAAHLAQKKYRVNTELSNGEVKQLPLKWITATALTTKDAKGVWCNEPSLRVLTGIGMTLKEEKEKYGAMRGHFALDVGTVSTKYWIKL